MTPRWSHNLFKGRVGEAVIEAVLSEFGYLVTRGGYEIHLSGNPSDAPDLIVEYPPTGARELVEVKYRSARPTAVDLSKKRILEYRSHHPGIGSFGESTREKSSHGISHVRLSTRR